VRVAPASDVRALIAARWLGAATAPERIGSVVLRPHQRDAIVRLDRLLREEGGALLADDVGLGKTYVAAALIRQAARPIVVIPASLRGQWRRALDATGARAELLTYTALSRRQPPEGPFDLVVMDEAHHARTPGTRRYARLAHLCAGARVLLLSATPIHNRRDDLTALLALFRGESVHRGTDMTLARLVVRREHDDVDAGDRLPELTPMRRLSVAEDDVLDLILVLPPPVPAADAKDGGALLAWSLVRQWASSRAALVGALRRRLLRAGALEASLDQGRLPGRREIALWSGRDDSLQLAFPELQGSAIDSASELRAAVRAHASAVRALLERLACCGDPDRARGECLRAIRREHEGERVLAFTQFADTARALYREVRSDGGVAVLTASGATIAGGKITRAEVLERFAPRASRTRPPRSVERIDLLIATDLLSEGLDLQDASVVVHLDLPWTPARIAQRVGRSRRLGALHRRTAVYALSPPASAERMLEVERRLREKLQAAARAVGMAGTILPGLANGPLVDSSDGKSAARLHEDIVRIISCWAAPDRPPPAANASFLVAAVAGSRAALVALAHDGAEWELGASLDGAITADAADLRAALTLANGVDAVVDDSTVALCVAQAQRWADSLATRQVAFGEAPSASQARRGALRRIAAITARAPHHRRSAFAELAHRARKAAVARYGVGQERVLSTLVAASMPDEAWLRAAAAFGDIHASVAAAATDTDAAGTLEALIIVVPGASMRRESYEP